MRILTKKLEKSEEYICYLQDSTGANIKAVLGKDLTEATAKMLDLLCFEMIGPATLKEKFVS
jgi:hypothetical protein